MDIPARHLIFHGGIVLLIGLMCGSPYGRAINRQAPTHIINAWRVAHASLPMGAMLMLAVAAVLSSFLVPMSAKWAIAVLLTVSSYAFCMSLPLAALTGQRGLTFKGPLSNWCVLVGNVVGAAASLLATLGFICAAGASL